METNIGLYSYGATVLAYAALSLLLLVLNRSRPLGRILITAGIATAIWAGVVAGSTLLPSPRLELIQLAEFIRNCSWIFLLMSLISQRVAGTGHLLASARWKVWYFISMLVGLAFLFLPNWLSGRTAIPETFIYNVVFATWLAISILGLLLLEQIFRNSSASERWAIKHLCLGVGVIFAFDFFMYAEALLFGQLDAALWQSRGFVVAFTAILIGIAAGRIDRKEDTPKLYLSRHVTFHTVTLLAAGIYLLLMALVGYFIRYLGGTWSGVLQITFLCGAGLLLLTLLFSGKVRASTRVWLSKNFFSYKYDYRVEWLQFTAILAAGGGEVPENIVKAIAQITRSPGGLLWSKTDNNTFDFITSWEMAEPEEINALGTLPGWLEKTEWIIDLQEWKRSPDLYENLEVPELFERIPRAWLIIPLMFGETLQGIVLLRESDLHPEINWEDRDLLKVAGRQAASHLAQYETGQALTASRQFEAFNRLSSYVIHDLKNILAQQSLIVSNAGKHRSNPAFVDDVINTVENSVKRMTRLMEQMRSGIRGSACTDIALNEILEEAVDRRKNILPSPSLKRCSETLFIAADREQMINVFNHIIQNAQEATNKKGKVAVHLSHEKNNALVKIEDDGVGMDSEFVRTRLFKPFDSTKGLTGMGIGAFESREFVRSLGGDIQVSSTPGVGSTFSIVLPCKANITGVAESAGELIGE